MMQREWDRLSPGQLEAERHLREQLHRSPGQLEARRHLREQQRAMNVGQLRMIEARRRAVADFAERPKTKRPIPNYSLPKPGVAMREQLKEEPKKDRIGFRLVPKT